MAIILISQSFLRHHIAYNNELLSKQWNNLNESVQAEILVHIWYWFWLTKHGPTNFVKRKFIWLIGYSSAHKKAKTGTQARNLGPETKAEIMEEHCYYFACHGLLNLLNYIIQDHFPGGGTTHRGVGFSTLISN